MRDDAEAAEPPDVFHDVARLSAQRIRRLWNPDRDVVSVRGAELDGIDDEHA